MKIAQFSDLHYSNPNLAEVDRCFAYAVSQAIAAGINAAVISGDSTDHALDLHAPAVAALAKQVRRLADHCPVLMLQGTYSHEPPGTLNVFRLLGGRYAVYVADEIKQVALSVVGDWIASDGWRFDRLPDNALAIFSCLPAVNKGAIAATVGAVDAAEAVGQAVADLLAGWGAVNRKAGRAGLACVGVSHGTVSGCVTEHGVPMAGLDHEFTTSALFAAAASAFLLGHIHKHQSWQDGERLIAYPGSIGRLHYGEEGAKGFLLWDVTAHGARYEFIKTPARRMLHLTFDGPPDMAMVREAGREAAGAFVRVRWNVPEEDRDSVDRLAIEAALQGAAEVKLEGRVVPVMRSRAGGISQAATLPEKVARWAEAAGVDAAGVLERLAHMETLDVEEIVRGIATAEGADLPASVAHQAMTGGGAVPNAPADQQVELFA